MRVPTLDLEQQYLDLKPEIDAVLQEILDDTAFILGKWVDEFESEFANYCGTRHCVGLNSGTAALHLLYQTLGLQAGDEVITSPFTFVSTVEPLVHLGVRPVFADINPDSYNLDPNRVEDQITDRTRAIVAVHLYGQPAPMEPLRSLADAYDLHLLEDAAQAHGARYREEPVGSLGDAAIFSFYPGKNLGAYGDAGAVTTDDDEWDQTLRKLRDHGRSSRYTHDLIGYNERMDGFQGGVLSVKLDHLDEWNQQRRGHAQQYSRALESLPVTPPRVQPDVDHVFHQYVIRTPERDRVHERLRADGIGASIHYPVPLHLQPSLRDLGYSRGDFPHAEDAADHVLSLPVFPELTDEQRQYVLDRLTASLPAAESSP